MKILICGPESTGKTSLAINLSEALSCKWIPEQARTYLEFQGPDYVYEDIEKIARAHVETVKDAWNEDLILDTFLLNLKIWSEDKFGQCASFIEENINQFKFDLILLLQPDLEWEPDPLRENPQDRDRIFKLYDEAFRQMGIAFYIIGGVGETRFEKSKLVVDNYIHSFK